MSFNPIIDPIRVVKKNNLQKVAGSRNMKIPTSTAPTAPIPVHTGYAVPNGIVCVALARNTAHRQIWLQVGSFIHLS